VIRLNLKLQKKLAIVACVLLVLFMTAEIGHRHEKPGAFQSSCAWCATAHVPEIRIPVLPSGFSDSTGEMVTPRVRTERSLFLIPLQRIRPPPNSSKDRI
jgi:hypothetical protein